MNDDKFRKLSDIELKNVSGGKTFSVKKVNGLFRHYGIFDEKGQLYAKCFTKSGADLECETLQKTDIYLTIKNQQIQNETYKQLHDDTPVEQIQY
jgi:hypothetical protein